MVEAGCEGVNQGDEEQGGENTALDYSLEGGEGGGVPVVGAYASACSCEHGFGNSPRFASDSTLP